jgi:hypothetical protein
LLVEVGPPRPLLKRCMVVLSCTSTGEHLHK